MEITSSGTYPPVVVPDTAGTVIVVFIDAATEGEPAEFMRFPVLAWLITVAGKGTYAYVDPIICELLPETWCIEQRVGGDPMTWVFPEDRSFTSFDEARRYAADEIRIGHARAERIKQAHEEHGDAR